MRLQDIRGIDVTKSYKLVVAEKLHETCRCHVGLRQKRLFGKLSRAIDASDLVFPPLKLECCKRPVCVHDLKGKNGDCPMELRVQEVSITDLNALESYLNAWCGHKPHKEVCALCDRQIDQTPIVETRPTGLDGVAQTWAYHSECWDSLVSMRKSSFGSGGHGECEVSPARLEKLGNRNAVSA